MTKNERRQEWQKAAQGSIELGRNRVQDMLKWSEYVADSELTTEQHAAFLGTMEALYMTVQPILDQIHERTGGVQMEVTEGRFEPLPGEKFYAR